MMLKTLWENNKLVFYFNDKSCYILKNEIIYFNSKSIDNGLVCNKELFIKDLLQANKKYHFLKKLAPVEIVIYLNYNISEELQIYYNYLFEEQNLLKITIKSVLEILDDKIYFINNKDSNHLIYNKKIYYIPEFLKNCTLKLLEKNKIFIFGNSSFFKTDNNYYIYTTMDRFIIEKIKNIAKK